MWANEILLAIVSFGLASWGSAILGHARSTKLLDTYSQQRDRTFAVAILLTSAVLLFVAVEGFLREMGHEFRLIAYLCGTIGWLMSFFIGRLWGHGWLIRGPIQSFVVMPSVFWFIARDATYSWADTFLFLGLTIWMSARSAR